MDISNMYVPNHKKWEKYYDELLSQRLREVGNHKTVVMPDSFLVPTETSSSITNTDKQHDGERLSVKLVSPVKQVNDQVVSELRRDSDPEDIKGVTLKAKHRSMKSRGKKGSKNSLHKKKQKKQRRKNNIKKTKKNKKLNKKRIKDIFTL